jgi:hypothetical protein
MYISGLPILVRVTSNLPQKSSSYTLTSASVLSKAHVKVATTGIAVKGFKATEVH